MKVQGLAPSVVLAKGAGFGDNLHYPTQELTGAMPETLQPADNSELTNLIRRGVEGDEKALEAIYNRFKTPLFSLACRYTGNASTAEDVLQEVFLRAFARLRDVNNVATFPAWLYRITVNASLSHLRSHKRERMATIPLSEVEGVVSDSGAGRDPASSSMRRPLEEAIQTLSPRLKSVLLLHDVQGFKHEEIASMLSCSVGTSKSNLFKARLKLRRRLLKSTAIKE